MEKEYQAVCFLSMTQESNEQLCISSSYIICRFEPCQGYSANQTESRAFGSLICFTLDPSLHFKIVQYMTIFFFVKAT